MTACAITLAVLNRRLGKRVERFDILYHHFAKSLADEAAYKIALRTSTYTKAEVEERTDWMCFAVCRKVDGYTFDLLVLYYDPFDPDDREYKRIHAEEVAEKLNERV